MNLFFLNIAYASESVDGFISNVNKLIINPLIILLFALALVYFLYGVFEFMLNMDDETKRSTGKSHMLWGVVGLTIMMGVWTILHIITNTLNISDQIDPETGKVQLK